MVDSISEADTTWSSLLISKLDVEASKLSCSAPLELFYTGDLNLHRIRLASVKSGVNIAVYKEPLAVLADGTALCASVVRIGSRQGYRTVERRVVHGKTARKLDAFDAVTYIDISAMRYALNVPTVNYAEALVLATEVLESIPPSLREQLNDNPILAAIELAKYYTNK